MGRPVEKDCFYKKGYIFSVNEVKYEVLERKGNYIDILSKTNGNLINNIPVSGLKRGGNPTDPLRKTVYGVGFLGEEFGKGKSVVKDKSYLVWRNMLQRCYFEKRKDVYSSYFNKVEVCEEWHNYSNFKKWYNSKAEGLETCLYDLDKDLYYLINNRDTTKVYSPETCRLLPKTLNNLLKSIPKDLNSVKGVHKKSNKYMIKVEDKYLYLKDKSEALILKVNSYYISLKSILVNCKELIDGGTIIMCEKLLERFKIMNNEVKFI